MYQLAKISTSMREEPGPKLAPSPVILLLRYDSAWYTVNVQILWVLRVDSRLRECDNYAFFAILAHNFKFPA